MVATLIPDLILRTISFPLPRFELAQRRAAKAGHIDTVDTQPFEATLAAERFEQGSPPVVSSQVAPPEEQPDRVCRSLARDFSNANLGKPDDNTGLVLGIYFCIYASVCVMLHCVSNILKNRGMQVWLCFADSG